MQFSKKQFVAFGTTLVLSMFFSIGCKKNQVEEISNTPNSSPQASIQARMSQSSREALLNSVTQVNDRLVFNDYKHLTDVMQAIEEGNDERNADFFQPLSALSVEQVNDSMRTANFDAFGSCREFEDRFEHFKSLRRQIEEKSIAWSMSEALDVENNPNAHPIRELGLRTILNDKLEVIINGKVENFQWVVDEYQNQQNKTVSASECRTSVWRDKTIPLANNKKFFMSNSSVMYPWGTSIRATQEALSWNCSRFLWWTNCSWQPYATMTQVAMGGTFYKSDCKESITGGTPAQLRQYRTFRDNAYTSGGTYVAVQKLSLTSHHVAEPLVYYYAFPLTW